MCFYFRLKKPLFLVRSEFGFTNFFLLSYMCVSRFQLPVACTGSSGLTVVTLVGQPELYVVLMKTRVKFTPRLWWCVVKKGWPVCTVTVLLYCVCDISVLWDILDYRAVTISQPKNLNWVETSCGWAGPSSAKLELSMAIWLVAWLAIELITWTKPVEIQTRFADLHYSICNIFFYFHLFLF